MPSSKDLPMLPHFIQSKVDQFFTDRVRGTWDGGHILGGKEPASESLLVNHNDYLDLGTRVSARVAVGGGKATHTRHPMMSMILDRSENEQRRFEGPRTAS